MEQKQKVFIECLKEFQRISKTLAQNAAKSAKELEEQVQKQEFIVPIIGGFSSGKSSFLNSFLQKNVLSTDIAPQTAISQNTRG